MYKPYSADRFVYHFTSAETSKDYILPTLKLRFSSYTKTNDPYETKNWSITIKDSLKEISKVNQKDKKFVIELIMKFNENRSLHINDIKSRVKTLCFSEDIKIDTLKNNLKSFGLKIGWGYPRMWAQYGSNHKGVCLMFDKKNLDMTIKKELMKNFYTYCGSVKYTDKLIDEELSNINFKIVKSIGIANSITNRIYNHIEDFFFKKAEDWQNEREYRYLLVPKNEIEDEIIDVPISNSLRVIILGSEIDERNEKEIEEIAKKINVRVYKMDWDFSIPMINNAPYQHWCDNIPNPFI